MDLSGRELEIPISRERILLSGHEGEIPIPITSTYLASRTAPLHLPTNGTPPPPLSRKGPVVKYKECLKNHAASIGGNATDGCGEFMPSGEEGTLEALKCSACNCHRNFHRKEIDGEAAASLCDCFHHFQGRKKGLLIAGPSTHGHMIMPLALQTSESDEMARPPMVKKRFRTKFTPEQKEKMLSFAERVGWRLQRTEETVVQQFCQEIGVKRRVLKVWMHNNKHNLAKKDDIQQIEC